MDTLSILCGMLGINPEELRKTAEMLQALAKSVDERLDRIEQGIARLELQNVGRIGNEPRDAYGDGTAGTGAGIVGDAATGAAVVRTNGAGD